MADPRGRMPPPGPDGEVPQYQPPFVASKDGGLDPLLLGSVGFLISVLIAVVGWLIYTQRKEAEARRRTAALLAMAEEDGAGERRGANVAGGARRAVRNRRVNYGGDDFVNQMLAEQAGIDAAEAEDDDGDHMLMGPDGEKIGKKKAAKLEMKAAKKAQREQDLIEREERKKREADAEAKRDKERAREQADEEAEKERLQKAKEEREARELEEYLKLKESFAVHEEGFDQLEGEEEANLLRDFIDYVKECKVVNIDELAAHFNLKSEEAVDRLQAFLASGDLTGVMDDRGKFIYITEEELKAVAKFIKQRGRVSIAELAEYSNRLIKLESC